MSEPSRDRAERLWNAVEAWIQKHRPQCAESVYQVDSVLMAAPELVVEVCEIVGWHRPEENDPDGDPEH